MPDGTATQLQKLAERVLACELSLLEGAEAKGPPAFQACDKLRIQLCKVFGVGGFRPLLLRALKLGGAKCSWLHEVQVTADGELDRFPQPTTKLDRGTQAEGEVILIAELLGLLVTFIGPALTLSLIRGTWPSLEDWKLENGTL